ncbi:MAG: GNAT family N-acetyltransferase [Treponema sp.]|jgi:ribosomal protein S18 acetylase RimI-like enzyme|nr:GNAT family N-acetyltransferase [Treponema sp.]
MGNQRQVDVRILAMELINIRKAVLSDLPYLYEICLKTGNEGKDASALFSDQYLLGHYYAAPYLVYQSGICFVTEYEYRPQGYIVAVPDTVSFRRWMEEQWLGPLRKQYPRPFAPARSHKEEKIIDYIHERQFPVDSEDKPLLAEYPAHLHIDLLPSLQGKGQGRALIDSLFSELVQKGVHGLHLGVSSSNPGAVAFYRKMGFSVLEEQDWGFTMGKLCNG